MLTGNDTTAARPAPRTRSRIQITCNHDMSIHRLFKCEISGRFFDPLSRPHFLQAEGIGRR